MRKFLSSVLALLMLISTFSCLTVTGFAADTALTEKESNDIEKTPNEIKVGSVNIGALQSCEDVDWYKFVCEKEKNDYFTISFNLNDITDKNYIGNAWDVSIYDNEYNLIISYSSVSEVNSPKFPIFENIYVQIKANDTYVSRCPVNISYSLRADTFKDSYWEHEDNDLQASVNSINANEGPYIGAMQSTTDVDWYEVNSTGDYFTLDFGLNDISDKNYVGNAWNITICDNQYQEIATYTQVSSVSSPEFPFDGVIYIKVQANDTYYSRCPVNIPYQLSVKSYEDSQWEKEYNNDNKTANTIEQGKNYKATLYQGTDIDYFKFISKTEAFKVRLSIDLKETSAESVKDGWKITVYSSKSSEVIASSEMKAVGTNETAVIPYKEGGEYYIKVEACNDYYMYSPTNAIYNLEVVDASNNQKWEDENGGNDFKYATEVKNNEIVYGNLYSDTDYDYYKFTVETDGVLNFTFNRDESDKYNGGWKIYLKDAAGNIVYENKISNTLTLKSGNINVKKGNYYLLVSEPGSLSLAPSSDINYNIQLNYAMYTPKITKLSNSAKGVTVQWNKTAGVASYILYRREYNAKTKTWSDWKAISKPKASATSYVDTTAKSGVSYKYTLRGVYGDLKSAYKSTDTIIRLAQPTTTVKAVSNGVNVAWTQSAGATGYTVYRMEYNAKTKKWSSWKKMGTTKKTAKSWTDKSAKKGVYYKYTVRAVNGSYASSYAASGKVKR